MTKIQEKYEEAKKLITGGMSTAAACDQSGIAVGTYWGLRHRDPKKFYKTAKANRPKVGVRAYRKRKVVQPVQIDLTKTRSEKVFAFFGSAEDIAVAVRGLA